MVEFSSSFDRVAEMRLRAAQGLALAGARVVDVMLDSDDRNTDIDLTVLRFYFLKIIKKTQTIFF